MPDVLEDHRRVWDRKRVLRLIYDDFYDRIVAACAAGMTIEIGGGIGNLKQRLNNVVTTDIQFAAWLDCVADAQYLPFATGTAANIVMVDVLQHIEFPAAFFREAERVLRRDGRLIMVEPRSPGAARCSIGCCTKNPFELRPTRSSRACPIRTVIPMIPTRRSRHCSQRATASASIDYFRISR
jgi:ubiquinone/menaquinone biosynthesis C-methylase UbiE